VSLVFRELIERTRLEPQFIVESVAGVCVHVNALRLVEIRHQKRAGGRNQRRGILHVGRVNVERDARRSILADGTESNLVRLHEGHARRASRGFLDESHGKLHLREGSIVISILLKKCMLESCVSGLGIRDKGGAECPRKVELLLQHQNAALYDRVILLLKGLYRWVKRRVIVVSFLDSGKQGAIRKLLLVSEYEFCNVCPELSHPVTTRVESGSLVHLVRSIILPPIVFQFYACSLFNSFFT